MAGENENNPTHNDMTALVGIILVLGLVVGFWYWLREYLIIPTFWIKWVEIKAYAMVMGLGEEGTSYLRYIENTLSGRYDASTMELWIYVDVMSRVGGILRFPVAALILGLAALVFLKMPGNRFKAVYNLSSFARKQSTYFRTLQTSVSFNADEANPMLDRTDPPAKWLKDRDIPVSMVQSGSGKALDMNPRNKVTQVFAEQLGSTWKGAEHSPTHVRAILAIMATHAAKTKNDKNIEPKVSVWLRGEIAVLYALEKNETSRNKQIEALIKPYLENPKIMDPMIEEMERHAYATTALMKALKWARKKNGVLASNEMLWLKGVDRNLWYCINWVGRHVSLIESAGAVSHYTFETQRRKPVLEPKVENAVRALEEYIDREGIAETV